METLVPEYYESDIVPHTVHNGPWQFQMMVHENEDAYLTRVERRLERKLTLEEACNLLAAYRSPAPTGRAIPTIELIPF